MKLTDAKVLELFQLLEIEPADLRAIQTARSVESANQALQALKAKAKRAFREAVKTCHPDHVGHDRLVGRFHMLTSGMKYIEALTVSPPKKPLRYKIRRVY